MKIVGITGGIGSGKTTVCKEFAKLGVPIYYADDEAKNLYANPAIQKKVTQLFGEGLIENGNVVRAALADIVFNDREKLQMLNNLMHPAVKQHFEEWVAKQSSSYVIKEAAILIETGGHNNCDFTLLVTAPKQVRIDRVKQRDGADSASIEARITKQWSDDKKRDYADAELVNDGSTNLPQEVAVLHKRFLKLSGLNADL